MQVAIQNNVLVPVLGGANGELRSAAADPRRHARCRLLQRLFARLLGMGVRPEHVRSPVA